VYATDKGLEELTERRGEEVVPYAALADRMRDFVDAYPQFENAVERLATFLARADDDWDDES
jgi:hypothetical protein